MYASAVTGSIKILISVPASERGWGYKSSCGVLTGLIDNWKYKYNLGLKHKGPQSVGHGPRAWENVGFEPTVESNRPLIKLILIAS